MTETQQLARKLWAEALRSGKYKQGKGCLAYKEEDGEHHCCLGVACEHHEEKLSIEINNSYSKTYDSHSALLPKRVQKWLGTDSCGHLIAYDDIFISSLSEVNDQTNRTFSEIADMVEGNLKDYSF